jgi:hypothetical protein
MRSSLLFDGDSDARLDVTTSERSRCSASGAAPAPPLVDEILHVWAPGFKHNEKRRHLARCFEGRPLGKSSERRGNGDTGDGEFDESCRRPHDALAVAFGTVIARCLHAYIPRIT